MTSAPFPALKSQTEIDAETRRGLLAFCRWLWARPTTPLVAATRQAIAEVRAEG